MKGDDGLEVGGTVWYNGWAAGRAPASTGGLRAEPKVSQMPKLELHLVRSAEIPEVEIVKPAKRIRPSKTIGGDRQLYTYPAVEPGTYTATVTLTELSPEPDTAVLPVRHYTQFEGYIRIELAKAFRKARRNWGVKKLSDADKALIIETMMPSLKAEWREMQSAPKLKAVCAKGKALPNAKRITCVECKQRVHLSERRTADRVRCAACKRKAIEAMGIPNRRMKATKPAPVKPRTQVVKVGNRLVEVEVNHIVIAQPKKEVKPSNELSSIAMRIQKLASK